MWGIMLAEAPPLASSTDGLGAGIILAAPFCRHTRRQTAWGDYVGGTYTSGKLNRLFSMRMLEIILIVPSSDKKHTHSNH